MIADPSPRYWDGRVRDVVATRHVSVLGRGDVPIHVLECGHEKSSGGVGRGSHPRGVRMARVCFECKPGAPR